MKLENTIGLDRLSIQQCESLAQDFDYDGATFDLVGPTGRLKCTWIDVYMGIFTAEGHEGFMMTRQFQYVPDIYCENLQAKSK